MTDLNTVFITGIPVLGSLLGALLGYVASIRTNNKSNKHALEIEKMRLEHETTMKEKERNRALLEELCSLVYGVQADIILPFIDNTSNTGLAVIASEKTFDRIGVIVALYYRDLIQVQGNLYTTARKLQELNSLIYQQRKSPISNNSQTIKKLEDQINQESAALGVRIAEFIKEIRAIVDKTL